MRMYSPHVSEKYVNPPLPASLTKTTAKREELPNNKSPMIRTRMDFVLENFISYLKVDSGHNFPT
jgi:hypothetical protein